MGDNLQENIKKLAGVPDYVDSSAAEKKAVIKALSDTAAADPQFGKKLSVLTQYNLSIDVDSAKEKGQFGFRQTLNGWSGPKNTTQIVIGVNSQDMGNMSAAVDKTLGRLNDIERSDSNRLFREIKESSADIPSRQRFDNYVASRERLESIQAALGQPIARDPYKLKEENRLRGTYGMPTLPSGDVSMPSSPRLSDVDCKAAMNNSAQGGTTTSVGGRLSVSPADIQMAAKDIMSKPKSQWPSLDNWDKNSMRALKADVGQETLNQMSTVNQAIEGIRAGGDREALARNIANPVVREMIVMRTNDNMSPQEAGSLQRDVMNEIRGNRTALNDLVKDERSDISQERRMGRAPVSAPACAPGS